MTHLCKHCGKCYFCQGEYLNTNESIDKSLTGILKQHGALIEKQGQSEHDTIYDACVRLLCSRQHRHCLTWMPIEEIKLLLSFILNQNKINIQVIRSATLVRYFYDQNIALAKFSWMDATEWFDIYESCLKEAVANDERVNGFSGVPCTDWWHLESQHLLQLWHNNPLMYELHFWRYLQALMRNENVPLTRMKSLLENMQFMWELCMAHLNEYQKNKLSL